MEEEELKNMNQALDCLPTYHITSYAITIFSFEDMQNMAEDRIITNFKSQNAKSIDAKKMTEAGAINDIRMGTMGLTDKCVTCSGKNCTGHWGLIKFGKDNEILNPFFVRRIIMVLNCVCHECSRVLFADEIDNNIISTNLAKILKKPVETRPALLEKYCLKIDKCPMVYDKKLNIKPCKTHIKLKVGDVTEDGIIMYSKEKKGKTISLKKEENNSKVTLHINKIINIFKNITKEDAIILGFVGKTRPLDLIMQGILVTPPLARAPSTNKKGELIQNSHTIMYINILKSIHNKGNAPGKIYKAVRNMLIKNDAKTGGGQVPKTYTEELQGKDGIYRSSSLGKRGDFNARSVAGPGHSLALNEIRLPDYWADILTNKINVTNFNYEYLNNELALGNIKFVISRSGSQKPADDIKSLKIGQAVEIAMKGGTKDLVMFGRQPSLTKYSMMGAEAVFAPNLTIDTNSAITSALNLDYDGDELNIWKPRSYLVKAELEYIISIKNCIISTETGRPTMGLVMNSKTSSHLITKPNVMIEEAVFNDMITVLSNKDSLPSLFDRAKEFGLEPITVKDGQKYVSGKLAFSALLPVGFNYNYKNVVVFNGIMISGTLNSAHVGSGARSLVNDLAIFYSLDRAADFITDAPHLLSVWFTTIGYTAGLRDCATIVTDSRAEDYNKKFNKRALRFEHELGKLHAITFNEKLYENLEFLYEEIQPMINKTIDYSLDPIVKNVLNNMLDQMNNIVYAYKASKKCKPRFFEPFKTTLIKLFTEFAAKKKSYKENIQQLFHDVTAFFNGLGVVSDRTYLMLKKLTNSIENAFILSGEIRNLDHLYALVRVDAVLEKAKDSEVFDNAASFFDLINDDYKEVVETFIGEVYKVVKAIDNCILPVKDKPVLQSSVLAIVNEQLLLLYSAMFVNLKNELGREYNKNILIKNEELVKINQDISALGSKVGLSPEEALHHERLVMEKTDIAKNIGRRLVKTVQDNPIINLTDAGSGTKGDMMSIGKIMGSVGQQYVAGKRLWANYDRLTSNYDVGDESSKARGLIESSFYEGLNPAELFFLQGASRDNVIDTAMLIPLVGKLQRLLARALENVIIAGDGSLRNTNGFMYAPLYNSGFHITKTIRVPTLEYQSLNSFTDLKHIIENENKKRGWYHMDELKDTGLKVKPLTLEEKFNNMMKKRNKTKEVAIKQPVYNENYKITVYEKARIIGIRAEMLNNNDVPRLSKEEMKGMVDALDIAKEEYRLGYLANKPALFIQRTLPGKKEIKNIYPTLENI